GAGRRDERRGMAVRDEAVVGDRRIGVAAARLRARPATRRRRSRGPWAQFASPIHGRYFTWWHIPPRPRDYRWTSRSSWSCPPAGGGDGGVRGGGGGDAGRGPAPRPGVREPADDAARVVPPGATAGRPGPEPHRLEEHAAALHRDVGLEVGVGAPEQGPRVPH